MTQGFRVGVGCAPRSPCVWVYVFQGLKREEEWLSRRSVIGCARINKSLLVSVAWLPLLKTPTYRVDGSIPFKASEGFDIG